MLWNSERRDNMLLIAPFREERALDCRPVAFEPGFDELRGTDQMQPRDVARIVVEQDPIVRDPRRDDGDPMFRSGRKLAPQHLWVTRERVKFVAVPDPV